MAGERNFHELLRTQNLQKQELLCVGLDTNHKVIQSMINENVDIGKKQGHTFSTYGSLAENVVAYNRMVIDATKDLAAVYKPNIAFYRALGRDGFTAMEQTIRWVWEYAPEIPVVIDAKVADIDNTNDGYVTELFDLLKGDAVTVHNYMGAGAMKPFLDRKDKGIFVLVKTSNPDSGELQDLSMKDEMTVFERVATNVVEKWDYNENCGVVAGATYPEASARVRAIVLAKRPILSPGLGAQGQKPSEIVPLIFRPGEMGFANASRSVLFAKRFEGESQYDATGRSGYQLRTEIRQAQGLAA